MTVPFRKQIPLHRVGFTHRRRPYSEAEVSKSRRNSASDASSAPATFPPDGLACQ